ncbi:MAG: hypothetical protein U0835_07805 [Isosphaeraceae bacterium]
MSSDDVQFIVSYACPQCQAPLETRGARAGAWLRCPKCGRPSQVPAQVVQVKPPDPPAPGEEVLVIGPAPEPRPMTPVAVFEPGPETLGSTVSPVRVFYSAALFVSVMFLFFCLLEGSALGNAVFSALAVLFFVLLLVPGRDVRGSRSHA